MKKWKWRTTATTDNGDDQRRPSTAKKSRPLILLKILDFRKIVSFWKTAKIWFFSKVPPLDEKGKWRTTATTDDGDDRRRPLMAKKSRLLILLKILDFRKIASFWKTAKIWFFSKVPPLDEKVEMTDDGDDRQRRQPTTTVDGEKISSTHFAKNLGFQKNCEFLKNSENLIFFKGPSLGWKSGNDERRRRRTTATTNDDRRRRKNLVHSFC